MNRRVFKALLRRKTGCAIQHDGWSCNSCFHSMELDIGNDRLHEMWQSVLAYRGDYNGFVFDPPQTTKIIGANLKELTDLLV